MDTIEDIVKDHIPFTHGSSSKGWQSVYCEVCGDGRKVQGPRGGWLFDGEACFYNCFNCGIEGNFDPNREIPFSKDMWKIFTSFNIPPKDFNAIVEAKSDKDKAPVVKRKVIIPKIDTLPDYFYSINEASDDDDLAFAAKKFLWDHYRIDYRNHNFFLSTGKTKSTDNKDKYLCRVLRPRIIIPAFHNDRMIYWQARTFIGEHPKKYISCDVDNGGNALYGMDYLFKDINKPLYITEGYFDSVHVNGVAAIRSKLSSGRVELLQKSPRHKVVIPDMNHDGMVLADQAIELGWGISLPKILPKSDICEAIRKFGKLYVIKSIVENTYYGLEAELKLKFFKVDNDKYL